MSEVLTRGSRESMRLYDLSDKELLAIIEDVADEEGWASRNDVAAVIFPFVKMEGPRARVQHALRCVGIRFAWLRRYGVLAKRDGKSKDSFWRLTSEGRNLLMGELSHLEREALLMLGEERLVAATTMLARHFQAANPIAATLVRREWLYGTQRNGR